MEKITGEEIRNRIGEIYQEMEAISEPSLGILNEKIRDMFVEVDELQTLCIHEFQDGVCIYCGKEED